MVLHYASPQNPKCRVRLFPLFQKGLFSRFCSGRSWSVIPARRLETVIGTQATPDIPRKVRRPGDHRSAYRRPFAATGPSPDRRLRAGPPAQLQFSGGLRRHPVWQRLGRRLQPHRQLPLRRRGQRPAGRRRVPASAANRQGRLCQRSPSGDINGVTQSRLELCARRHDARRRRLPVCLHGRICRPPDGLRDVSRPQRKRLPPMRLRYQPQSALARHAMSLEQMAPAPRCRPRRPLLEFRL